VTSYLFPTERDWMFDMTATIAETPLRGELASLPHATRTTCPFDASMTIGEEGFVHVPAMVEGFGLRFVEQLGREVSYFSSRKVDLHILGEALASIPTDEALQTLAQWKHLPAMARQLAIACKSYPARAARLGIG
jgi:hypothetical protein